MSDKLIELLISRQEAIFKKLDEVSVQQNELIHIKHEIGEIKDLFTKYDGRMTGLENDLSNLDRNCIANHPKVIPLGNRVLSTVLLTAVTVITTVSISFIGYLVINNAPGFSKAVEGDKHG